MSTERYEHSLEGIRKMEADLLQHYRNTIDVLLSKCTTLQQRKFQQIYPNGVPPKRLIDSIKLLERTIRKNEENKE